MDSSDMARNQFSEIQAWKKECNLLRALFDEKLRSEVDKRLKIYEHEKEIEMEQAGKEYRAHNEMLARQLKACDEDRVHFKKEFESLQANYDYHMERELHCNAQLTNELQDMRRQHQNISEENERLAAKNDELMRKLQRAEQQQRVAKECGKCKDLELKLEHYRRERRVVDFSKRIEHLKSFDYQYRARLAKRSIEVKSLRTARDNFKNDVLALQDQLSKCRETLSLREETIAEHERKIELLDQYYRDCITPTRESDDFLTDIDDEIETHFPFPPESPPSILDESEIAQDQLQYDIETLGNENFVDELTQLMYPLKVSCNEKDAIRLENEAHNAAVQHSSVVEGLVQLWKSINNKDDDYIEIPTFMDVLSDKTMVDIESELKSDKECIICYNSMIETYVSCNVCLKKFHCECLTQWRKKQNSCPTCRAEL